MKTMNKRFITKAIALALSILISCPYAFAEGVGKVTYVEGRVDILKTGSDAATTLREGDEIAVGDALRTKSNSKAEVAFNDKTILRVAQNSKVEVSSYEIDKDNRRKAAKISLERGKVRTVISKMPNAAEFIISTPNAEGTVKGSDIFAFYQAGNSGMLVAEGRLSVANVAHPEEKLVIPAGNSVLVPLEDTPKGPRQYFELERKLHEQDTNIPVMISKREKSTAIKGVITKISGKVSITPKDAASRDASINDIISEGDRIETGENGMIEIKFDNGNAINLKPGTNLLMGKLVFDPATGEYENIFESSAGRIRARIENLKGKSKFEVKTPTAVSGARGTIMYLTILANLTQVFFDGGDGYISSLISNITKTIAAGSNAASDNLGNVSDPVHTTDSERESLEGGWDPGSGVEGYSAPEGAGGSYLFNSDTGTGAGPNLEAPGIGGSEPFSGFPFTETVGPTDGGPGPTPTSPTTPPEPTPSITINLTTGGFLNPGSLDRDPASSLNATLTSETTTLTAPWFGIEPFNVNGGYSTNGNDLWFSNVQGTGTDGGTIFGWMGGSWHSWEGVLSTIYIDPSGIVGLIFGYLSGTNDDAAGTFTGSGDIFIIPMEEMAVLPPIVVGRGSGELYAPFLDREGYIDTSFTRDSLSLMGERWGIWRDAHIANYNRPAEPNRPDGSYEWTGVAGGSYNDDGYFITAIEGIDDLNGALRMDIASTYMDYDTLGGYLGTVLGTYTERDSYYYEGVGLGTFEEEALTFSGYWGEDSLYSNDEGSLDETGEDYGIIGSTTPDWWNADSFPFVAMGEYRYGGRASESTPKIWNTPIQSYNVRDDDFTTLDGGAFYGFTGGIWYNGEMDGAAALLYTDPDGNAGILWGDVSGNYYPDLEMWMATGTLAPHQMARALEISPENFIEDYIYYDNLSADVYGEFLDSDGEGESYIDGWSAWGKAYFIVDDYDESQSWGIYDLKLEGPDSYYNPEGSKIWTGEIEGEGYFGYNESQGVMRGALFGVYDKPDVDGYGTWIGTSIGAWYAHDVDDAYADDGGAYYGFIGGIWDDEAIIGGMAAIYVQPFEGDWDDILRWGELSAGVLPPLSSGSFEGGGSITLENFSGGVAGIIDQPWGIWSATMNGSYTGPTSPWKLALGGSISGEGYSDSYWLGTLDGKNWENGRLIGDFGGILLVPTEGENIKGGIISGNMVGTYIDVDEPGTDTWQAVGVGEWVEVTELLDPDQLGFSLTNIDDFVSVPITEVYSSVMTGPGTFNGAGSISAVMDMNLYATDAAALSGIWAALIDGSYSGTNTSGWSVNVVNGTDNVTLTGVGEASWVDNEWVANVSGTAGGNDITGQAAGTYTGTASGTFSGVGAGTWNTPQP